MTPYAPSYKYNLCQSGCLVSDFHQRTWRTWCATSTSQGPSRACSPTQPMKVRKKVSLRPCVFFWFLYLAPTMHQYFSIRSTWFSPPCTLKFRLSLNCTIFRNHTARHLRKSSKTQGNYKKQQVVKKTQQNPDPFGT